MIHAIATREAAHELRDHGASCALVAAGGTDQALEALHQLRAADQHTPVIVLTDAEDEAQTLELLRAGATDCVARATASPSGLRRTLTRALEHGQSSAELIRQALHDSLTGLPNRNLFLDRLRVALDRLRRSAGHVSVLFIDLDDFKEINDTFGHAAGDQVLKIVAGRLRKMLRPSDTVARLGGDEFTLLFEGLDSGREVLVLAERIQRITSVPIALEGAECVVHASIGIATTSDADTAAEEVLREADAAMYRAKDDRRSQPAEVETARSPARRKRSPKTTSETIKPLAPERQGAIVNTTEAELRKALLGEELAVHYQPKVSLGERAGVLGVEALVRWRHPRHGLVGPSAFIPLAEQTGLIVELGRYVIDHAVAQLESWREVRPDITLSVNLSPAQLDDSELAPQIAAAMQRAHVEPRALCIEVPERALGEQPELAGRAIASLKAIGVTVAIDDYGAGAGGLASLRELEVDTIKIHGSFVSEPGSDARPADVVGAVVELCHTLGMSVIAKGVETESQMSELQLLGCDEAQGYYFSRPVPAEQVGEMLLVA